MSSPTSIRDCMHRNPLTINRSAPLVKAIELLVEFKLTGLTVIDEASIPCGKITELDCIRAVLNAIYNDGSPENIQVDVQELDINQSIHLTEIKLPDGVEFLSGTDKDHDSAVVKCYQPVEEVIDTAAPEAMAEPEDATASKDDETATEGDADDSKES